MAEQKYVMIALEDYEELVAIYKAESQMMLRGLYGRLTGECFIDKNDRWEIDREEALKRVEKLYDMLGDIDRIVERNGSPYDELVYTESEIDLLREVLNERED